MKITRTSSMSGVTRTLDLPITADQWNAYKSGQLIQNAMPHLTDDEREFILTGMTAEEWDQAFPDEPDCDDFDDAFGLASAGFGTDEDYGGYH